MVLVIFFIVYYYNNTERNEICVKNEKSKQKSAAKSLWKHLALLSFTSFALLPPSLYLYCLINPLADFYCCFPHLHNTDLLRIKPASISYAFSFCCEDHCVNRNGCLQSRRWLRLLVQSSPDRGFWSWKIKSVVEIHSKRVQSWVQIHHRRWIRHP